MVTHHSSCQCLAQKRLSNWTRTQFEGPRSARKDIAPTRTGMVKGERVNFNGQRVKVVNQNPKAD